MSAAVQLQTQENGPGALSPNIRTEAVSEIHALGRSIMSHSTCTITAPEGFTAPNYGPASDPLSARMQELNAGDHLYTGPSLTTHGVSISAYWSAADGLTFHLETEDRDLSPSQLLHVAAQLEKFATEMEQSA